MSKEVAAAILTQVYYRHVPDAGAELKRIRGGENVDEIGDMYAQFLGRMDLYQGWSDQYDPKKKE